MNIDLRIAAAGLVAISLGAGWSMRALTERAGLRGLEHRAQPVASPALAPSDRTTAAPAASPVTSEAMRQAFDDIYRNARWGKNDGGEGNSGLGSLARTTLIYRTFLERFMKDADVHSVVDAGCGDWEFSSSIDWAGIDYKGFDIVESVIEKDKKKYERPNVHFFVADVVHDDLPAADLLIVKHVLQHLPTAAVQQFLTQIPKYRHVLLVDSVDPATLSSKNPDITPGAFRPLDVTRQPFNVHGAKLLTYWDGANMQQAVYVAGQP